MLFALNGTQHEIDLNDEHAAQLHEAFATYVGRPAEPADRRLVAAPGRPPVPRWQRAARAVTAAGCSRSETGARANNHQVSDHGQLAAAVLQAYGAAHS